MVDSARIGDTKEMTRWFNMPHDGETWHSDVILAAAQNGQTETMLEAVKLGCPWPSLTTAFAAQNGHTDTMLAAVDAGCPWSKYTTEHAAYGGYTKTMLKAVQHGCPWGALTTTWGAFNGHADTIRAALDHGCPRSPPHPHGVHMRSIVDIVEDAWQKNKDSTQELATTTVQYVIDELEAFLPELMGRLAVDDDDDKKKLSEWETDLARFSSPRIQSNQYVAVAAQFLTTARNNRGFTKDVQVKGAIYALHRALECLAVAPE